MSEAIQQQYEYIKSTRQILLTFLEGIPLQELHKTVPNFGHKSIIETNIHVADCYLGWISKFGLKQTNIEYVTESEIEHYDIKKIRDRFELVDEIVQQFIDEFNNRWLEKVVGKVNWQENPWSTTPLWLLTHTETHEFHHKGQVVTMARHLGFAPPETDLIVDSSNVLS